MAREQLISIIDDDPSMVAAVIGLLRSAGYRTSGHASAEAFLASGDSQSTNCVITDIQMPGMTGIALKHHLAARDIDVPVIMITARTEASLLDRARTSGAFCLLGKPFDANDLIGCVKRALAKPA